MKKTAVNHHGEGALQERLEQSGRRMTAQRQHVYDVLMEKKNHPTAEEVFIRAKKGMPEISMATVYNCLDALVQAGMARQVKVERGAARFCPNMHDHWHFHCNDCGGVFDMNMPKDACDAFAIPRGFKIASFEIAAHGHCPDCNSSKRKK